MLGKVNIVSQTVLLHSGLPWYEAVDTSLKNQIQENKENPLISGWNNLRIHISSPKMVVQKSA